MSAKRLRGFARVKQDDKKRLALPSRYRAFYDAAFTDAGDRDVVCALHHKQDCLMIWLPDDHDEYAERIERGGMFDQHLDSVRFRSLNHADDLSFDKQWRILIPQDLRERAGIGDDIVMLGEGRQLQIWDAATYEEEFKRSREFVREQSATPSETLKSVG